MAWRGLPHRQNPGAGRVSPSLRAAWLGHTVEVTRKNYPPKPKDLTPVSTMLSDIFKARDKNVTKPGPASALRR
jgi:hypothetical protein